MLALERAYLPDDSATFGRLTVGDAVFYTLEPPWKGNQQRISCIPEGVYTLRMRDSKIVSDTTGGEFTRGWEVTGVLNRTFIMFHVGNWERNTDGCILVGSEFSWHAVHGPMVASSLVAFRRFMAVMAARDVWVMNIFNRTVSFP